MDLAGNPDSATYPAIKIAAITPGSAVLSPRPRSLFIEVAGDLEVDNGDGTTATVTVPVGVLPLQPYKLTAGTTATVFGLY